MLTPYPWIPLFAYKPKPKLKSDNAHHPKNDCSNLIKSIEQEFLQCRKDRIGLSRRKAIARLLDRLNVISSDDFLYFDLKVKMLAQASREARNYKEFHDINLEIDLIYDRIFQMLMSNSQINIAVTNFVNWAIDYSQLAGNSVELNKIISKLNSAIKKINTLIRTNTKLNKVDESELLVLRSKSKRAKATLLQKRRVSGQKSKKEIYGVRNYAYLDAKKANDLNNSSSSKHELALCLFATTSTMDSDNAIKGLELLNLAYEEGALLAAYELARQLDMRHREEEAMDVFKSVAEKDDDRRRFHSNVIIFANSVIGLYYKNSVKEKYIQDALLACQWIEEVISYEHYSAKEIVCYCNLKLICGYPAREAFEPLEMLRPMSSIAWNQLVDIARKLAFGDDSMAGALLLGLEDASVWNRIGTLYSDFTNQFNIAIEFYDRAILIDKRCPIYHFNKALTLAYKLHDYEGASTELAIAKSLKRYSYAWFKQHRQYFKELENTIQN